LREALGAIARMRTESGIGAIGATINCVPAALFTAADMMKIEALSEHAQWARQRRDIAHSASRARRELGAVKIPVTELPMLFAGAFDRDAIGRLSEAIEPALALTS
jgi:hypothetical protein